MPPPLPTLNAKLAPYIDRLKKVYVAMDQAYSFAADHYGFKCTGCGDNCCLTRFYHHTYLEYLFILNGFRCFDADKRVEVIRRAQKVIANSRATDKRETVGRQMCPLNFDGSCILYFYRPMICRLHGIPHEFQTHDHRVIHAPGCDAFTRQHGNKKYFKFDRTPFYAEMAQVESELKQVLGVVGRLKMTVAEMIESF